MFATSTHVAFVECLISALGRYLDDGLVFLHGPLDVDVHSFVDDPSIDSGFLGGFGVLGSVRGCLVDNMNPRAKS